MLAITTTADERCHELLSEAEDVAQRFRTVFVKFANCHNIYSGRVPLSEGDIMSWGKLYTDPHTLTLCNNLYHTGENITNFIAFYRTNFPESTITPKLHLLEDHILPFLKTWKVGFGLLGEQGAESIHTAFNQLGRTYANIHNGVERLHQITVEHHRRVSPLPQREEWLTPTPLYRTCNTVKHTLCFRVITPRKKSLSWTHDPRHKRTMGYRTCSQ